MAGTNRSLEAPKEDTDRSAAAVPPDQRPKEILREFQRESGTSCQLVGNATITDVTTHELQLRIDRTITAEERHRWKEISYPSYQSELHSRTPFDERYETIPERIADLYDELDKPAHGWVDGEDTAAVRFQEDSGRSPQTCDRCDGSGEKECPDCNVYGQEPCPRCSDSSERKDGYIACSHCDGEGTINCSNCNSRGKVRTDGREKETCPKCGGEAKWPCDHCDRNGRTRCPNHCNDGMITCRRCRGSQEVDCDKCDTSGKIVRVKTGDITYQFTEELSIPSNTTVNPSLILAADMECVAIDGNVNPVPGADELLDADGEPSDDPVHVADVTLRLKTPMLQLTYEYAGRPYELYKVGDLIFFDKIPTRTPRLVQAMTIMTVVLLAAGVLLLFVGPELIEQIPTLIDSIQGAKV